LRPVDKLWWLRYTTAILVGVVSGILSFTGIVTPSTAFIPAIIAAGVYFLIYYIARVFLKIVPEVLPKRRDMVITGLVPYVVSWFAFWFFVYTLLRLSAG